MKDISCKVYFARCIDPDGAPMSAYKIGCSHGLSDRIKQQTNNLPFTLDLAAAVPGNLVMEAACHLYLKDHRIAGEYFRASDFVEKFVSRAAANGTAFHYFQDLSDTRGIGPKRQESAEAFMLYHGIEEDEVRRRLGLQKSTYEKQRAQRFGTRKWIAATGLILESRRWYGTWPHDVINGLCGEVSHFVKSARAEREAA